MQVQTKQLLRNVAPAALSNHPANRVSDKYHFFSTRAIIDALGQENWAVIEAKTAGSRRSNPIPAKYRRHELAFADRDVLAKKSQLSEIPRIMLSNSHDANAALRMHAGLYRFICSNGMVIGDGLIQSVRIPHTHQTIEQVIETAQAFRANADRIGEHVEVFKGRQLTHPEIVEFGRRAISLRQPDSDSVIAIDDILRVKRTDDAGSDLWRVFNRAQEWLLNGGYPIYRMTEHGWTERTARPIVGIDQNTQLNTQLWDLAELFSLN